MTNFESNILNIYGDKGKAWLAQLPELVKSMGSKLSLRELIPVPNLTYNYVLFGFQGDDSIVLKLSLDQEGLKREACALKCFAALGAVNVITEEENALLLKRAVQGISLKSYFPNKDVETIKITCKLMKQLHRASIPENHNFPHIKDWLSTLSRNSNIFIGYLNKARELRDQLLETKGPDVLLHGDLHHYNILQNGENWVVIDPKGVIGESAYEVAIFIRNPIPELLEQPNALSIIQNRIVAFAKNLNMPSDRILNWCFVQSVLAWIWSIDDGCDVDYWERITKVFYKML